MNQQNQTAENKMGVQPILPLLLSMSLPSMASMLVQALYNIVDGIYVAHIDPDAMTAISLAGPIQMFMISVAVGTGVGVNSLISRRLGQKNQEDANAAASHSLLLAVFSWMGCALLGLLFTKVFFNFFSPSERIFEYGVSYLSVVMVFSIGLFLEIACEKIFQSTGSMVTSMLLQLTGTIINIVLDPILIFGLLGAPKLGVRGAAIATVLGQLIAGCVGLSLLMRGKKVDVQISFSGFKWNRRIVGEIYKVGLPSILNQSIGSLTAVCFNTILMGFSASAVWVMGTYAKLENFLFMPLFGLTHGILPLAGYNFGASNRQRMKETQRHGLLIGCAMMTVGTLVFWIFPRQLLGLFAPTEELLELGVPALRLISICFPFAAISIVLSTVFQAVGKGSYTLWISLLRQIIVLLPCAWALSFLGLRFVWAAFPISNLFSTSTSVILTRRLYRTYIDPLLDGGAPKSA